MGHQSQAGVIIPAAGRGRRFGGEPKQYRSLGGMTVLDRTVEAFQHCGLVGCIVVAAPEDDCVALSVRFAQSGFDKVVGVTAGGDSRQQSVRNGLLRIPTEMDPVLIHDAVRPFVTCEDICAVIRAAAEFGAAAPALSVTDTLRKRDGSAFGVTVPRDGLLRMQTPQGFRREVIEEAFEQAGDLVATDDVELVQRAGYEVRFLPGSALNIKITTPDDWQVARALWADRAEGIRR